MLMKSARGRDLLRSWRRFWVRLFPFPWRSTSPFSHLSYRTTGMSPRCSSRAARASSSEVIKGHSVTENFRTVGTAAINSRKFSCLSQRHMLCFVSWRRRTCSGRARLKTLKETGGKGRSISCISGVSCKWSHTRSS